MTRIIALIPARGGSKGLPRKNLAMLGGKPLVAYSIETALACPLIERTIVTTDDQEIAAVARRHGAEVPFMRPAELGRDDTVDFPVFLHALQWLRDNEGDVPELVVQLRPTSPFRAPDLIQRALDRMAKHPDAHCLRTINLAPIIPYRLWQKDGDYLRPFVEIEGRESWNMPRQDLPQVYWHNGVLDVIRSSTILELGSISGSRIIHLEMDDSEVVDIDTATDLARAEFILNSLNTGKDRQP